MRNFEQRIKRLEILTLVFPAYAYIDLKNDQVFINGRLIGTREDYKLVSPKPKVVIYDDI